VIYTDPPWSFRSRSAKGTGRNAISHYDCLIFEKLAALPVGDLAAKDCALFLWAVDPLSDKAFELIRARGEFDYKTVGFYWVKQNSRSAGFFGSCLLDQGQSRAVLTRDARKADPTSKRRS
jgi:N6-adenosine-specific RNA methylase IME4